MKLNLLYVHGENLGYGRLGVKLAEALENAGVEVFDDISGTRNTFNQGRFGKCNVACWVSTPSHASGWWEGQIPAIFSMWEATRLPESFRENLHNFDTVLVPSDQNVELFSRYHHNVKRVPLGIDRDQWRYQPRKTPGMTFDFLIGGSGPRKGTDLAFSAFIKAFPENSWGDGPIPQLVMKNPKGEDFWHPRVQIIGGKISAEDEIALYARSHCYLQPSRGEGFGLQPLQAIAQGMPTILTDAHGHASFAHLGYGLSTTMSKAAYFIYGDAGEWWEPSLDELIDRMRWVYDHYDEATAFAAESSKEAHERFTWENCAEQFLDGIGRDRLGDYTGSGRWVQPVQKLYPIVTVSDYRADIGDRTLLCKAGETYYESADVKRIMFEAGVLDPVCFSDDDTGLVPEQAAKAKVLRADAAFCPTCRQQLNTHPTKADVLYEWGEKIRARMGECGIDDDTIYRVFNE